ncbi:MAG: Alkaline phosphatase synthesis transcriptional regulatory protein PhoP [Candidatus Carbobacillus altaicus]|uniref:Alkaline phosphatase synthesis transcriptional regulatory protein PhoP n=1 Tax=Candidatus Carbonibacillus altaicus TaxID=2163959 RepID=A0A2R6XYK4_9BACL|nr:MAG: Alkaline phosphatase synthesis transcriptional regulatory protein PhoP [Candidatus Carbobacillus altaicus]
MKRILIVDDEPSIVTLLKFNLEKAGYDVITSGDGRDALMRIEEASPDLILLDLMLPGIDGMDVLKRIRALNIKTPVIMITARDEELDKVLGLELGADDYITKPFRIREVLARMKAIFRRLETTSVRVNGDAEGEDVLDKNPIQIGDLEIDLIRYEVLRSGEPVDLTPKEYDLLFYMARHRGKVLSREQLLNHVWNYDFMGDSRIVDVHVSHLREKLERDPRQPKYIKTVRGLGYKLEDRPEGVE